MPTSRELAEAAAAAEGETADIDFKERFDPNSRRDWCETIKDIVAMANSGGGCLVFGVRDDGTPSGWEPSPVLNLDPARVTDRVSRYTARQFAGFEVIATTRGRATVAVLVVREVQTPLIFTKPGTYPVDAGHQKTAFAQGTLYFRHGTKSEPGTAEDLAELLDRRLTEERDRLLKNIRMVLNAPEGYMPFLIRQHVSEAPETHATSIQITNDAKAPEFRPSSPDSVYPLRQKEVIEEVNRRLRGRFVINQHDALCIRTVHQIDETKPEFFEHRRFGAPQYTFHFVEWIIEQFECDPDFFARARLDYRARQRKSSRARSLASLE